MPPAWQGHDWPPPAGVTARQLRFDMLAGVSQVGQNAQVHCAIGASQLQRFAGIVRYGEGSICQQPRSMGSRS